MKTIVKKCLAAAAYCLFTPFLCICHISAISNSKRGVRVGCNALGNITRYVILLLFTQKSNITNYFENLSNEK